MKYDSINNFFSKLFIYFHDTEIILLDSLDYGFAELIEDHALKAVDSTYSLSSLSLLLTSEHWCPFIFSTKRQFFLALKNKCRKRKMKRKKKRKRKRNRKRKMKSNTKRKRNRNMKRNMNRKINRKRKSDRNSKRKKYRNNIVSVKQIINIQQIFFISWDYHQNMH